MIRLGMGRQKSLTPHDKYAQITDGKGVTDFVTKPQG